MTDPIKRGLKQIGRASNSFSVLKASVEMTDPIKRGLKRSVGMIFVYQHLQLK